VAVFAARFVMRFSGRLEISSIVIAPDARKAQGSAFATNGIVRATDFNIVSGESELTGYEATPGQTKYFCKHCGSPIISRSTNKPDEVRVRIGTIESDISERPQAHIFVTSKANWEDICGNIPMYDEYEPDR
jgi:hypothetical protein